MNLAAAARIGPWANALSERGHEVLVLTAREAGGAKDSRVQASRFGVPSNQSGLVARLWQEFRLGRDLAASLARQAKVLDGVVITSPPFFMASLCVRASRKAGLPYVFDVRDRYPSVLFELGVLSPGSWAGTWLSGLERKAYHGARIVTTVTRSLQKHLSELTGKTKVARVPNGFDGSLFSESLLESPKRKEFTVVYHGRFSRLHDVEALRETTLEAQRRQASIQFLVIGPIPDSIRAGDWGNTEFLGEVPRDEIPKLLAQCHLGVSLMKTNEATTVAFPAKVFEYLGAGLPVLASPVGEMTDFLEDEEVGIVFSHPEPGAMADALINLANDRTTYDRLAAHVRVVRPKLDRGIRAIRFAESLEELFSCSSNGGAS